MAVLVAVATLAALLGGAVPAAADFPDVPPGAFYTEAVNWLEDAGLTTGVGSTGQFQPNRTVSRAEAATFLWRLMGSQPAPPSGFSDVPAGAYYATAVGWLKQQGFTTGVSGTNRYAPDAPVTRAELATLLWRLAEMPVQGSNPFPDVPPNAFYSAAVRWMVDEQLTAGVGCTGLFQPNASLTRGMLATFVHRYAGWDGGRLGAVFTPVTPPVCDPHISVTPVMTGLQNPWGVAFAPDGTMIVTERPGRIRVRLTNGTVRQLSVDLSDVRVVGETGLMGVEVDPDFAANRRIYACMGHESGDVRVVALDVDAGWTAASRPQPPIVSGIPGAASGHHAGCQLEFTPDGHLLIGTGDALSGSTPQSLTSLAGKTLRVNEDDGEGVAGNPFIASGNANTRRIFTYGHRNVQGLAIRPTTGQMFSVEHGPNRDDEINLLVAGSNYGWDPVPGYNQNVPMTAPGASGAARSSGSPTIATSGADFLHGSQWELWDGRLAVASLKDSTLRIFSFGPQGQFLGQFSVPELAGTYGRLRGVEQGPDGSLYVTSSNGGGDQVLRVTPS